MLRGHLEGNICKRASFFISDTFTALWTAMSILTLLWRISSWDPIDLRSFNIHHVILIISSWRTSGSLGLILDIQINPTFSSMLQAYDWNFDHNDRVQGGWAQPWFTSSEAAVCSPSCSKVWPWILQQSMTHFGEKALWPVDTVSMGWVATVPCCSLKIKNSCYNCLTWRTVLA